MENAIYKYLLPMIIFIIENVGQLRVSVKYLLTATPGPVNVVYASADLPAQIRPIEKQKI
jgi:hypothetical protein